MVSAKGHDLVRLDLTQKQDPEAVFSLFPWNTLCNHWASTLADVCGEVSAIEISAVRLKLIPSFPSTHLPICENSIIFILMRVSWHILVSWLRAGPTSEMV